MATQVSNYKELELQDGTIVTVKSLPIARLRRFMEEWEKFPNVESEGEGFTIFVSLSGISLEHEFKDDTEKFPKGLGPTAEQRKKGEVLSKEYKDYLEEILDIETIYEILEVAGGLKLNDPKLLAETAAALTAAQEDGQN